MTSPLQDGSSQATSRGETLYSLVCTQALPIWGKQIETARSQTESAVVSLTQRFSERMNTLAAAAQRTSAESHSIEDQVETSSLAPRAVTFF